MKDVAKIYQNITQTFIDCLNEGEIPWTKPWFMHAWFNIKSKREYQGFLNVMLMGMTGYEQPAWGTMKNMNESGLKIAKGSKATWVTFWKMMTRDAKDSDGNLMRDSEGNVKQRNIPILKGYRVFNIEQCEDTPEKEELIKAFEINEDNRPIPNVDEVIKATGISVRHGGVQAYYAPKYDYIQMPEMKYFKKEFGGADAYYKTLFHELVHATGAKHRLDRDLKGMGVGGKKEYAKEELVAEIGSAFLANIFGLNVELDNSKAYIQSWIKALEKDPKLIVSASSRAEKAVKWIMEQQEQQGAA